VRFNTLSDWLTWQETLHPEEIELGLERIRLVWHAMHEPAYCCPVISVAGTNGKGSSVAMLEAIYLAAGYRVGSYTSPHLYDYNERIRIAGKPVEDQTIIHAFEVVDQARQSTQPETSLTYFEFGTLAALHIFAQTQLDIILLEVGLGGRLDAVNIIDADVALITTIDLDHQAWLGETKEQIASEKAGILRENNICIISDPSAPQVIEQQASRLKCHCFRLGREFSYHIDDGNWCWQTQDKTRAALPLPALNGKHQCQNAAGVIMVIEALSPQLPVNQQALRTGLLSAQLPGRFEIRQGDITVILDVAHNQAAAETLAESLKAYIGSRRVWCIFSILADKDIRAVIRPFIRIVAHWSIAPLASARAMQSAEIEKEIRAQIEQQASDSVRMIDVESHSTVKQAFSHVQKLAQPDDVILAFGSFYLVAELGVEPV
jgi:dihydrofolate synthase/folylpolyglutamate synthase